MRAAVLEVIPAGSLSLIDVSEPVVARPDDAIVEVEACGICGTDLHIVAGHSYRPELPFVLGHEPVGVVVNAGEQARQWIGRRVTTTLFEGCTACEWCRAGDERLCPKLRSILGVHRRAGAFAERFAVSARQLVPVPDELGSVTAATLVDSGATAMNAVDLVHQYDQRSVVVVGGGPVGLIVAELLAWEGRPLVVVEPCAARQAALATRGHAVISHVDELQGPIDCVVECSGAAESLHWACERLDPRGLAILAGYAVAREFDFAPVARKELTVRGVRSGGRKALIKVLAAAAAGHITPPTASPWALSDVNEALSALGSGAIDGKAVITPRQA